LVSRTSDAGFEDQFSLRVRLEKQPRKILSFRFQYAQLSDQNRSELDMSFELMSLVEFNYNATHPIYTGDERTEVNVWPSSQMKWNNYWSEEINDTESGVWKRAWNRSSADGLFTVRIHVAQLVANGTQVKFLPNSIKFDLELDDYVWKSTGATRVAFLTKLESMTTNNNPNCTQNCIFDNNVVSFKDSAGHPLGVFSWDTKIKTGNTNAPVVAYARNSSDEDQMTNVFFTFLTIGHPTSMHWDPLLGLNYDNPSGPMSPGMKFLVVFAVVILVIVLVAVIYFFVRRYHLRDYYVIQ